MALLVEYAAYASAICKCDNLAREEKCEYAIIRTPGGDHHSDFQVVKNGETKGEQILYVSYVGVRPEPKNVFIDPLTPDEMFAKYKREYK